ncbi:MAG: hypothetical protein ABIS01_04380 [Ferruginibacter sp.]
MRNLILFGLLIIMLLAAQFSSAKTVEEVIEKYLKARGGKTNLAAVQSIYMEGIRETPGKEVTVKIAKEQDKLSRTEIETGVATGFILITDKAAWTSFSLRTPAAVEIPGEDVAGLQHELDIAGPLVEYAFKGHAAELIGKDTVEGDSCYKIRLTLNTGNEMMFWIDTSTYLLIQSRATSVNSGGVKKDSYTRYRNYREINGVQFAHTLQTKSPGAPEHGPGTEILFYKILVNSPIDPGWYQPV